VSNVQRMRVLLGEAFVVTVTGQGDRLQWFADNDEILTIDDDGGNVAKMKADSAGHTEVQVQRAGRVVHVFYIEVFKAPAGYFAVTVGPLEQK
jgi:hypothetical protein